MFLADVAVDYRVTTATVPVLSNSSVADGMQGQELDVALTIDSDVALQASTITPTASIQFADYTFTTTGLSYYVLAERGVGCAEGGECGKP